MNVHQILDRLELVRERGGGQWSARCPAHEDRGPSLSIKEVSDGRILLHCFAGCGVSEVTAAIGVELQDLFPPQETTARGTQSESRRKLLSKGQALELLQAESLFAAVCAGNLANGVDLAPADRSRLMRCAGRIAYLRAEAMS